MAERIEYSKRERNIPQELHDSWIKLRRKDDVGKLTKYCGVSRPVIDAALKNGYVSRPALASKITDYFNQRPAEIMKIDKSAAALIKKANSL